jgi:sulfate adenylyltransferase (ADP) / ATP adenylyltransferase
LNLWDTVRRKSALAHASGAMYRIESEPFFIEDGGVEFVVRKAVDYKRQAATMPRNRPGNPFADPEPELFVADVSPTHYALLNKYHVIENHLLVVTREFVDQEALLDRADFEALVACLPGDVPAIGFYNGGAGAGASQPHKHLQVVTLPLSPHADIPMAPLLAAEVPRLPFPHAFARIDTRDPARLLTCYRELLRRIGVDATIRDGIERQSGAYNILVARGWMMAVPRARDRFADAAINSLAFAGALFVRDDRQLGEMRRTGPMAILAQAAAAG